MGKVTFATIHEEPSKQFQRSSKLLLHPAVLFTSLLAFLASYNLIQDVHDAVQSFLTVKHWEVPIPSITLRQGIFRGKIIDDRNHPVRVEAFLGIPYALPPVGERRFSKPVVVPESNRTFDATRYSAGCPGEQRLSTPRASPHLAFSEDCLRLNIFRWRHTFSHRAELPVYVHIHDGDIEGEQAATHDTASMLAWSEEPYLAISFNYRFGAFGFLNSQTTAKNGALNLGLHDQKLLLEWIQQNAVALGANPNDVTIAGSSGDLHSIGHHLTDVKEKRQLFHKAIMEAGTVSPATLEQPDSKLRKAQFDKFVAAAGCSGMFQSNEMKCLRSASMESLVTAQKKVYDESRTSGAPAWQPVVDGDIVSSAPQEIFKTGSWHKVPILTGFNHVRRSSQASDQKLENIANFTRYISTLIPGLSKLDLGFLDKLYPEALFPGAKSGQSRAEVAYNHFTSVCPVRQFSHLAAIIQDSPVWLYHWSVDSIAHVDRALYETMSPLVRKTSTAHDNIARVLNAYMTSFIVTGDPNQLQGRKAMGRPVWDEFRKGEKTMVFGNEDEAARLAEDKWAEEECKFWWEISGLRVL